MFARAEPPKVLIQNYPAESHQGLHSKFVIWTVEMQLAHVRNRIDVSREARLFLVKVFTGFCQCHAK